MISALISLVMFLITIPVNASMLALKLAEKKLSTSGKSSLKERLNKTGIISKLKKTSDKNKVDKQTKNKLMKIKLLRISLHALLVGLRLTGTVLSIIGALISLLMPLILIILIGAIGGAVLVAIMSGEGGSKITITGGTLQGGTTINGEIVVSGDNSSWVSSCQTMWNWYTSNVRTYQHCINYYSDGNDGFLSCKGDSACSGGTGAVGPRHGTSCSLLDGGLAMDDCSAFVSACLVYAGYCNGNQNSYGSSAYRPGESMANRSEFNSNFTCYTPSDYGVTYFPKVGDIMVQSGHVEIFAGIIDGTYCSWSWGSVPKCVREGTGNQPCTRTSDPNVYFNNLWSTGGDVLYIWQFNGE